jgi:hypothetical protein
VSSPARRETQIGISFTLQGWGKTQRATSAGGAAEGSQGQAWSEAEGAAPGSIPAQLSPEQGDRKVLGRWVSGLSAAPSGLSRLARLIQGRCASLGSALAPGYLLPRRWRSGLAVVKHHHGLHSSLNSQTANDWAKLANSGSCSRNRQRAGTFDQLFRGQKVQVFSPDQTTNN